MIDKNKLREFVESRLERTDCFLVDLTVSPSNQIKVEIDSDTGIDIDFCVSLTREIEAEFPRDDEDYELEVGSAGFTSPFKVLRQYEKNLGNEVEVLARDGRKYTGILESADADRFTISYTEKVKEEGSKKKVERSVVKEFTYPEVNSVKYVFKF